MAGSSCGVAPMTGSGGYHRAPAVRSRAPPGRHDRVSGRTGVRHHRIGRVSGSGTSAVGRSDGGDVSMSSGSTSSGWMRRGSVPGGTGGDGGTGPASQSGRVRDLLGLTPWRITLGLLRRAERAPQDADDDAAAEHDRRPHQVERDDLQQDRDHGRAEPEEESPQDPADRMGLPDRHRGPRRGGRGASGCMPLTPASRSSPGGR